MDKKLAIVSIAFVFIAFIVGGISVYFFLDEGYGTVRSSTTALTQVINPGTLSVDIVNGSYVTVGSPSVTMNATNFSFACSASSGALGTATEQIYVKNPDAADAGWSLTIAASAPTAVWDSAGTDYDFNDPTTAGCTDGADSDSLGGQMTMGCK